MRHPFGAAVDGSGNLYVAEDSNNRVLFFPNGSASSASATKVFGQADFLSITPGTTSSTMHGPLGMAADGSGNLYVADTQNNRVLFFPAGSGSGASATVVFGQPDLTSNGTGTTASTMNSPSGVAVDGSGNLYVADGGNNRVLFFPRGSASGADATQVFGEPDFTSKDGGTTAAAMSAPSGLAVDGSGNLYVADWNGNRVLVNPPASV
jgi:sugar lactone lactonase YvrE